MASFRFFDEPWRPTSFLPEKAWHQEGSDVGEKPGALDSPFQSVLLQRINKTLH